MIRLQEFITKIRNCKTTAEQRAEYQIEMAAIRESFAVHMKFMQKNQESLRCRNVTKLLFINMSGQQTTFGQMECLNLIASNALIQKRIGYLGLTQLFHAQSQLLIMATNKIRVDLMSPNLSIVGLALCVLSEICTVQLSKQLHNDVLKCINNNNGVVRKKAILTSIKIIKKSPEYIAQFLPKISHCLEEKGHGVLLSCMAFLENVLLADDTFAKSLVDFVPKITKVHKTILMEQSAEYQVGGINDPFLQVAILRFLKLLYRHSTVFERDFVTVLANCHDSVCGRFGTVLKNGGNAVLLQCFQCMLLVPQTSQLKEMVGNVLTKFISVKDANSKYLSILSLNNMTNYDLKIVKSHRTTIFECLSQNDILIRVMALDLLSLIAGPSNVDVMTKELILLMLTTPDEQFIAQMGEKVCLMTQKHAENRRWHFDTMVRVLVLANHLIKEQSVRSLVHFIVSTPQLQQYAMVKLFFAAVQNVQNNALCKVTMYLLGEFVDVLLRIEQFKVTRKHVLDLIENILFKVGIENETIAYGLSALLKLHDKFVAEQGRIATMIGSFKSHSDMQVQKRACEYTELLKSVWDADRKKQICIAIPPFQGTLQSFKDVPVGDITFDFDSSFIQYPRQLGIVYDMPSNYGKDAEEANSYVRGQQKQKQLVDILPQTKPVTQTKPIQTNVDNSNIFDSIINAPETNTTKPQIKNDKNVTESPNLLSDGNMFDLMGMGMTKPKQQEVDLNNLLGFDTFPAASPVVVPTSTNNTNLFGDDLLKFNLSTNPTPNNGFNSFPQPEAKNDFGINLLGNPSPTVSLSSQPKMPAQSAPINPNKILAYQNQHIQIWMDCVKDPIAAGTTKLYVTYSNKSMSAISEILIQAAVVKTSKLVIDPMNATTLPPMSQQGIHQTMVLTNSLAGQKGVVMKFKLAYITAGQKYNFEEKIGNFPTFM